MLSRGIVSLRGAYEVAVECDVGREGKRARVEGTDVEILLLAGADDCVWDIPGMARLIRSHATHATICSFPDAGHLFEGDGLLKDAGARIKNGGTEEGNERARVESTRIIEDIVRARHRDLREA